MRDQIHKPPDVLRVNLHVITLRPPSHRAAGALQRFLEKDGEVLAEFLRPLPAERGLHGNDPTAIKATHDARNIELPHLRLLRYAHMSSDRPVPLPAGFLA
jgi:hypothetical protein